MKTIYSLKEFHEKAVEISGREPELVAVTVDYGLYHKMNFTCYAAGLGRNFSAETMEESLRLMKESIQPPALPNIDVEIDIEHHETVTE